MIKRFIYIGSNFFYVLLLSFSYQDKKPAPLTTSEFVFTSTQWITKRYALPTGVDTNSYWVTKSPLPIAKSFGTGVGYSRNDTGWIYILGGYVGSNSVQRFNIRTNTWTAMALIPVGKDRQGSAILKDSIYCIGGVEDEVFYTADFFKYDINTNTWVTRASLPGNLGWGRGAGYQDSLIYVAGGYDGGNFLAQVLLYNANTNTWRNATPLPAIRFGGGFASKGDTLIYVSGADGSEIVSTVYKGVISQSDRSVITWTNGAPLPGALSEGMYRFDAHSWGNRGIIITGGTDAVSISIVSNACLVYSPGADVWTTMPNKITPWTAGQSGVAIDNGAYRLVCSGGFGGTFTLTANEMFSDSSNLLTSKILNLTLLIQGFFNSVSNTITPDTVRVYLRNSTFPYAIVDSAKAFLNSTGNATLSYTNVSNNIPYYIQVKHRNSMETWSKSGGEVFTTDALTYNFTTNSSQAYGSNQIQLNSSPIKYAIYSGDVNQDEIVDGSDMSIADNDAFNFLTGYLNTDVNGDNFVDATDLMLIDNNAFNFISVQRP